MRSPPPDPNPDIDDYCSEGNYEVDWDLWKEYYKQMAETEEILFLNFWVIILLLFFHTILLITDCSSI